MPLRTLRLQPGVNVELTPTLLGPGWSQSQLIRWFAGQLQKYGGWTRIAGVSAMLGTVRGLFGWSDYQGIARLAVGTDQRLYVMAGGARFDITPIVATTNAAPALSTTAGSTVVTIADNNYQPESGNWITLATPVSRGGIVLNGAYQIQQIQPPFSYTITAATPATTTSAAGGTVPVFATTSGSATVRVTLASHGLTVGGILTLGMAVSIGGLVLSGDLVVAAVIDTSTFQITAVALANATTSASMNSAQMRIQYYLPSGTAVTTQTDGYGLNDWGSGDYGQGSTNDRFTVPPRLWSLDHFGQDLIASPDQGGIYYWTGPDPTPAVVVDASAPLVNTIVLAVAQAQILVALGSSITVGPTTTHYPTLIRWCDSGDFTDWVATVSNQAGSYQLPTGSYITAALATGLGILIWTDVGLWTMTYQGLPYVFGFNQIGLNCEVISRKAVGVVGNWMMWPSTRSFFLYQGGQAQPVECPVWDIFWDNIDVTQTALVFAATNTVFSEVAWFFPTTAGTTMYVKFNYLEKVWDYGTLDRTAWVDHSPFGNPIGADSAGYLYNHESSNDADDGPMVCYAQSGYYELQEGADIQYVNCLIPDFIASNGSQIQLTVLATDYPGATPRSYGPYTASNTSQRINLSLRGRQIALRVGSSDLGSFWRTGAIRFNIQPAGTRP